MAFSKYRILLESKAFKFHHIDPPHKLVLVETNDKVTPFAFFTMLNDGSLQSGHYFVRVDSATKYYHKRVKEEERALRTHHARRKSYGNPLTKQEAARLMRMGKYMYREGRKVGTKWHDEAQAMYYWGVGEGYTGAVSVTKGGKKAKTAARKMSDYFSSKMRDIKYARHRNPLLIVGNPYDRQGKELKTMGDLVDNLALEVFLGGRGLHGGLPEGHYVALSGCELDQFYTARNYLISHGFITSKGYLMKPTKKLNDAYEALLKGKK